MAQLNFDARAVAPDVGFDTVPAGWYNVMADESEIKPTRQGDGAYLQVRFNVLDGQYAGRKLFSRFNIRNSNPTAQEIGFKQLSALAHAVGHLTIGDSSELHNRPLKVKVKIRKDKEGQYEDQNEITSYKNINEQVDTAVAGAPAGFAAPQAGFTPPPAQQQQWAPPAQQSAPPAQQQQPPAWSPPAQAQQPAQQQAPVQQQAPQWQAPPAQQPWNAAPQNQQQPPAQQQQAPAQQQAAFNPASAVPPWQQQR